MWQNSLVCEEWTQNELKWTRAFDNSLRSPCSFQKFNVYVHGREHRMLHVFMNYMETGDYYQKQPSRRWVWQSSALKRQCSWCLVSRIPTAQGSRHPEHCTASSMRSAYENAWHCNYFATVCSKFIPGLEFLGAKWVGNVFNWIAQTVSVVISWIDAPLISSSVVG